jgi:DNA-directed RNA polymerase II subunit RPB2
VLRKEFLPHVGSQPGWETRKAFFFGYMIHRLLMTVLSAFSIFYLASSAFLPERRVTERRDTDDRDHFGNKRVDTAGPLMATLFRQLFRRMTDEAKRFLQKEYDASARARLSNAIKPRTISKGLQYALATGTLYFLLLCFFASFLFGV